MGVCPGANDEHVREFVGEHHFPGLLIVVPVYLAVLLLLKGMKSVGGLVRPIAALLPDWIPGETLVACCSCWLSVSAMPLRGPGPGASFARRWKSRSSGDCPATA